MHGMRWPPYRRSAGLEPAPRAGQRMIRREWECPSLEGADQTGGFRTEAARALFRNIA
jgi:hypothetical protein